jgi:putative effector of murein hydrolase LrgA (UPF0299 family)
LSETWHLSSILDPENLYLLFVRNMTSLKHLSVLSRSMCLLFVPLGFGVLTWRLPIQKLWLEDC